MFSLKYKAIHLVDVNLSISEGQEIKVSEVFLKHQYYLFVSVVCVLFLSGHKSQSGKERTKICVTRFFTEKNIPTKCLSLLLN